MVLQKNYKFDTSLYPPVLARPDGKRSPRSRSIDPAYVQAMSGPDGIIQRIIPPATALATIPGSDKLRPLPRTRVGTAITTSSTTISVSPKTARFFKSTATADSLVVALPYARIDFALTWANADTATLTIDGQASTHTVADFTNLTALATAAAATFQAAFGRKVKITAENQFVHVWSLDGKSLPISSAEVTAGNGTFAVNGSVASLQSGVAIGTVASVNVDTDVITLTSTASIRLPAGIPIGANGFPPFDENGQGWGFVSPNNPVDLEWEPNNDWGLFIGGTFYKDRMPHFDTELMALFPQLTFD